MLLKSLPNMSRPQAFVELSAWALMAVPMGVLSGGVTGVLAHTVFGPEISPLLMGFAVALLTGAGAMANIMSAAWAHWSQGRRKIQMVTGLQTAFCACLLLAALVPLTPLGLVGFIAVVLAAQVLWSGIITVRASVWRQNYTRRDRTAFAAQNQVAVSLIHACTGAVTGWLVDKDPAAFRWILLAVSVAACASLFRLRRIRLRQGKRLLGAELKQKAARRFDPRTYWAILSEDALYRRYMKWMMVLGSGNLMFTAPLILVMTNQLHVSGAAQVWIAAALPTLVAPFATPYWARHLSREHVITFRSRNSRWYAAASLLFAAGCVSSSVPMLWVGAAVLGIGIGGGTLGWNLGHNDFTTDERVSEYIGLHVSLTGIRGLIAPLAGVALYGALESSWPGSGRWALLLPAALTSIGAIGFYRFNRTLSQLDKTI
jgi:MFS family permease